MMCQQYGIYKVHIIGEALNLNMSLKLNHKKLSWLIEFKFIAIHFLNKSKLILQKTTIDKSNK